MLRVLLGTVVALLLFVGVAAAEEIKGKVKKVEPEKGYLTLTVGEKERLLIIRKETKLVDAEGKELEDGLKAKDFKEGAEIIATTEGKGKKAMLKEVKIAKK